MKHKKSLLTQCVLASTIFCLYATSTTTYAALTPLDAGANGQNSGNATYPPTTGYNYTAPNVTFTIRDGDNIGMTAPTSVDNTGNNANDVLIFAGSSTVAGNIGTTHPILEIDVQGGAGSIVLFNGTVNNLGANGLNFSSATATPTTVMEFGDGANVTVGNIDNKTGNVNIGTLQFDGTSTIAGTISATNSLNAINVIGPNGGTVSFQKSITAQNINFTSGTNKNTAMVITADTTTKIDLSTGVTITGNVDNTTGTTAGILQFEGTGEVTGTVGATRAINAINVVAAAKTATFDSNVTANTLLFTGAATNATAVTFADGTTFTGAIDTNLAGNIGKVQFLGSGVATGNIGASNPIALLEVDSAGSVAKTVELQGAVIKAASILVNDDASGNSAQGSTLVLNNANMLLTAPITVTTNNEDALNILNANTLTGNIGAGGKAFNLIQVGQNGNTTVNGNIFATTTEFFGNNALTLGTGNKITGAVDSTVSGNGILNFAGVGEVTGAVGGVNKLGAVNIQGGVGNVVTFDSTVGATNINVQTPGVQVNFVKSVFSNVNFTNNANAASIIIFQNTANMNGNIDNTTGNASVGTVAFAGNSTVTGTIGDTNSVDEVQLAGAGTTVNFQGDINVGAGDLVFTANATASINNNVSILGNVDSTAANQGTLNFLGNGNMLGTIGATNALLAVDLSGGPGTTVFFGGNILNATPIVFKADGIANINNGVTVSGTVDTGVAGTGTVQFLGNATVNGIMGATGLKAINILGPTGSTVTFNQNIAGNTPLNFLSNGTASIADGKAINNVDNISGATTGILAFQGSGIVGNIGATTPINLVSVNTLGAAGKTLTFDGTTVNANTINVTAGAGTKLNFANPAGGMNINANITTNNNNLDTISIQNVGPTTITGNIGAPTNTFAAFNMTKAQTLTMAGNIFANNIQFQAAATLQFNDSFSAFGPITTTAGNQGIVTYLGSSTIGSPIGTGNAVNAVNINGPAGSLVNLNAAVNTNNFSINNGATLLANNAGAINSVNPVTVNNGVLDIAPSTTLNINGALVMNNANAILQMDMGNNLNTTGKIVTTGNATVQAPAKLTIANPGFSSGKSTVIPIVVAGGVGAYAPTITNANTFLTQFSTLVTGNTLNLVVTSQTLASVADQSNTAGVGGALDSISTGVAPGELGQIMGQLANFGDQASLNFDLSTLAPTVDGALLTESFASMREIYDSIDERFDRNHFWRKKNPSGVTSGKASGDGPDQNSRWVKVIHQHANQQNRDNVAGYKDDMWGLVAGGDTYIQDNMMLGVGFSWTNLDIRDKLIPYFNRTTANSFQATVYGSMDCNSPYYFDGVASIAYNHYATQREIIFGTVNLFPRGEYHAWQTGAKAETGYVFEFGDYHAIPVASLLYSHLNVSGYSEEGAGFANQTINDSDFDMLLAGVGVKGTYDYGFDAQRVFQIQAHAMAFYDFVDDQMALTSQFVGAGPNFVTNGFRPARASYNLGGNLTLFNQKNWTFTASYDFDFKEDYTANAAFMRARYEW